MRHYAIWKTGKGWKELYSITDSYELAKWDRDHLNEYYKQEGIKFRAYITYCDDGKCHIHKEIK